MRYVIAAILVVVGGLLWLFCALADNETKIINECMADGNKYYQCIAMMRGRR